MEKNKESTGDAGGRLDDAARRRMVETAEREDTDRQLAELAKDRNLADAPEMINYANIKKKLELPSLGYHVEYCPLRIEDEVEIDQIKDDNPEVQQDLRNRKKAYLILSRADSRWTDQVVKELAAVIIDAILMEYDTAEDTRFLLPIIRRRSAGLRRALVPSESS